FDQTVAVADEKRVRSYDDGAFFVEIIFHYAQDHAALVELQGGILTDQKRGKMTGVGIAQIAGGAVVNGDEEGGEAIVAGIAHQMFVEAGNELGGAHVFAAVHEHLATQRGLQASHQERGRNSLAGNIGNGNGHVGGAELDEIVVVTADFARRFANGFDLDAGHLRQDSREELVLNFARDGNFVFEALALLLLLNQGADRTDHVVEGFAEDAELIAAFD